MTAWKRAIALVGWLALTLAAAAAPGGVARPDDHRACRHGFWLLPKAGSSHFYLYHKPDLNMSCHLYQVILECAFVRPGVPALDEGKVYSIEPTQSRPLSSFREVGDLSSGNLWEGNYERKGPGALLKHAVPVQPDVQIRVVQVTHYAVMHPAGQESAALLSGTEEHPILVRRLDITGHSTPHHQACEVRFLTPVSPSLRRSLFSSGQAHQALELSGRRQPWTAGQRLKLRLLLPHPQDVEVEIRRQKFDSISPSYC